MTTKSERKSQFYSWLMKQTDRDDPTGDVARDVAADKRFPFATSGHKEMRGYLVRVSASHAALEAFDEAVKEFQQGKKP